MGALTQGGLQPRLQLHLLLLELAEELLGVRPDLHGSLGLDMACKSVMLRRGEGTRCWGRHGPSMRRGSQSLGASPGVRPAAATARTLYLAPLPPVEAQRLHEAVVLLIRPALALLGDCVGLAHLQGGAEGARAWSGRSRGRGMAACPGSGRQPGAAQRPRDEVGRQGAGRRGAWRGQRVALVGGHTRGPPAATSGHQEISVRNYLWSSRSLISFPLVPQALLGPPTEAGERPGRTFPPGLVAESSSSVRSAWEGLCMLLSPRWNTPSCIACYCECGPRRAWEWGWAGARVPPHTLVGQNGVRSL